MIASVGQAKTQSRQPVQGSLKILAFLFTSMFRIGLAKGVSYNSIASSSHTSVHWSHPMQRSSLTKATVPGPPFTYSRASVRIELSASRILAASFRRLESNSSRVVMYPRWGQNFSKLPKRKTSAKADEWKLSTPHKIHKASLLPYLGDHILEQLELGKNR